MRPFYHTISSLSFAKFNKCLHQSAEHRRRARRKVKPDLLDKFAAVLHQDGRTPKFLRRQTEISRLNHAQSSQSPYFGDIREGLVPNFPESAKLT